MIYDDLNLTGGFSQIGNRAADMPFEVGAKQTVTMPFALEAGHAYVVGMVLEVGANNYTLRPLQNGNQPVAVMVQQLDLSSGVAPVDNDTVGVAVEGYFNAGLLYQPTGDDMDRVRLELSKIGIYSRTSQYSGQ